MKRGTRVLVALGLGFVTFRIAAAVIPGDSTTAGAGASASDVGTALVLGLIVALCTWATTVALAARKNDQAGTVARR